MKDKFDEIDEVKDKEKEDKMTKIKNGSHLSRMISISEPKWMIFYAVLVSILMGAVMPFFGIFIGRMLFVLQPIDSSPANLDDIRKQSDINCLIMFCLSVGAFFFTFNQLISFGTISENVTLKMRIDLYTSILAKNIGWFDDKDNTPGILSSTMATEAQTVNGVVAGGLATSLQAFFSVMTGVVLGFYFNWKVSLVCLGCVPFMILGGIMNAKFQQGMSQDTDEAMKDANVLAGDSIINYRTVASFANEDQILSDYDAMLQGPVNIATKKCHVMGVTFGFSQFVQYGVYAIMFYASALFLR